MNIKNIGYNIFRIVPIIFCCSNLKYKLIDALIILTEYIYNIYMYIIKSDTI